MSLGSKLFTFLLSLTQGEDLLNCRPSFVKVRMMIANDAVYNLRQTIKEDIWEDLTGNT